MELLKGPLPSPVKGIEVNRERPLHSGWCGNDDCEHLTHKSRRAAQAAADKRKTKK